MALRPYAAAKRTLSLTDKLGEVNWGLMLLICLIAIAGIAMLYSVAGAGFPPWAPRQIGHFMLGLIVLLAAAMVDIRVWMSLGYPADRLALLPLVGAVLVVDRSHPGGDCGGGAAGLAVCAARLSEGAGGNLPGPGIRRARQGLEHHPGQDRHRLRRGGGQGLHPGHPEPAELPARKADRLHLDQF